MKRNGKILFASLKGGVGKSTAASCIAAALAGKGYRTVIADLDFRTRSLDILYGVTDRVVFTFDDYILGRCRASEALITTKTGNGGELMLCPAPDETVFESHGEDLYARIPEALNRLGDDVDADYVICDTGADSRIPGIVGNGFAELAVIVCGQSRTSIRAAETTAERLSECDSVENVRLLINDYDNDSVLSGDSAGVIEMIDSCSVRCIGVIPHEDGLSVRQNRGRLPAGDSPTAAAALNIAGRITGREIPLMSGVGNLRRKIKL